MVKVKEIEKLQIDQEKSNKDLAQVLGISHKCLLEKKRGRIRWSLEDVKKICEFLEIKDPARIVEIFLGLEVRG